MSCLGIHRSTSNSTLTNASHSSVALILTETEQALRVEVRFDPLTIDIENLACSRFSKIAALLRIAAFCAREASGQSHIAVAEQDAAANARFPARRPQWLRACFLRALPMAQMPVASATSTSAKSGACIDRDPIGHVRWRGYRLCPTRKCCRRDRLCNAILRASSRFFGGSACELDRVCDLLGDAGDGRVHSPIRSA
jgi:hypothetical protein